MKQFLLILTLTICASLAMTPVHAADSLSAISNRLTKAPLICGSFTQSKTLEALTRPLLSTGRIVFVEGKGVLWQVLEPFPTRVLVKKETLTRWNDEGVPQTLGYGPNPIFNALSQVFLTVFTGRIERLKEAFLTESSITAEQWTLTLIPRTSALSAIIVNLRISGRTFVDQLLIDEKRGDRTVIQFADMTAESCRLSDAQKDYFAQ